MHPFLSFPEVEEHFTRLKASARLELEDQRSMSNGNLWNMNSVMNIDPITETEIRSKDRGLMIWPWGDSGSDRFILQSS
jgi:hypothetical protein